MREIACWQAIRRTQSTCTQDEIADLGFQTGWFVDVTEGHCAAVYDGLPLGAGVVRKGTMTLRVLPVIEMATWRANKEVRMVFFKKAQESELVLAVAS